MTQSIWKAKAPDVYFPELREEIEVDVAVIGGGITGITNAHLLSKTGTKVFVLFKQHKIIDNEIIPLTKKLKLWNIIMRLSRNLPTVPQNVKCAWMPVLAKMI